VFSVQLLPIETCRLFERIFVQYFRVLTLNLPKDLHGLEQTGAPK
jgi:hypothetical protein